jgi:type IV pilus assembly protein PilE
VETLIILRMKYDLTGYFLLNERDMNRKSSGFTLIELMVAVLIVGILAAIAIPSYQSYLLKGNRTVAQVHLMNIAQQQQHYLLDSRSYAPSLAALSMTTPTNVSTHYTIEDPFTVGTAPNSFSVTATPIGSQANDQCGTLAIDNVGNKTPVNCW